MRLFKPIDVRLPCASMGVQLSSKPLGHIINIKSNDLEPHRPNFIDKIAARKLLGFFLYTAVVSTKDSIARLWTFGFLRGKAGAMAE